MDYNELFPIVVSILNSVITGGFVLVFIEIGNRKNRENDRHFQIMFPFMHKLSAYFRFLSLCRNQLDYPEDKNEYEDNFKGIVEGISKYGKKLIISRGDYPVGYFTAEELNKIALDINNIWYWHDQMHPCNITWFQESEFITKELKEFGTNYLNDSQDVYLLAKVSGYFFTDIYQQIEDETYRHEDYMFIYNKLSYLVAGSGIIVLIILCLILFIHPSFYFLRMIPMLVALLFAINMILLGMNIEELIGYYNKYSVIKCKLKNLLAVNKRIIKLADIKIKH